MSTLIGAATAEAAPAFDPGTKLVVTSADGRQASALVSSRMSPVVESPARAETASQRNARLKAGDYLDMSAFSRKGLIEQLEYEGFSAEDAVYGTDSLNADWNEQAAKKARDYLDMSAFSRSGLVDQLMYEGFTRQQAEFGVSQTGL
ncbi:Ltp family lipoprotein [Skermania sp. ID1734]|uniref:Ltp family lipoprotein n=1 Tax=Skermania sp. ID1734 TaxID=2597516 RepID=UPI002102FD00|nr:Ltp family lipoprotein [Skermania sp. ID1734]